MPNIYIKDKKPKSCNTCRFNKIDLQHLPYIGYCDLLNEQLIMTKIEKRLKKCPFNTKKYQKTIFKKIIKEIKKCLKLKKKPKSLT